MGRGGLARHIKTRPYGRNGRVNRNATFSGIVTAVNNNTSAPVLLRLPGSNGQAGKRFGRLVSVEYLFTVPPARVVWRFKCDCGEVPAISYERVATGETKSCGCLEREQRAREKAAPNVSPFIAAHGLYETVRPVSRDENIWSEQEEITINRRPSVIDGWFWDDEAYWLPKHVRVIERCKELWRDVGMVKHFTGSRASSIRILEGEDNARASNLLKRYRLLFKREHWNIFENVVRWNEPNGRIGSSLFPPTNGSVSHAKAVVWDIADTLAREGLL